MHDDDEEQTIHGMDDGQKYKLLKFWKSCELSKKHLDSIEDVVEIVFHREIDPFRESFNKRMEELEKSIAKERADREREDALVRQTFSTAKWLVTTAIATLGVCVGYLGLK